MRVFFAEVTNQRFWLARCFGSSLLPSSVVVANSIIYVCLCVKWGEDARMTANDTYSYTHLTHTCSLSHYRWWRQQWTAATSGESETFVWWLLERIPSGMHHVPLCHAQLKSSRCLTHLLMKRKEKTWSTKSHQWHYNDRRCWDVHITYLLLCSMHAFPKKARQSYSN